MTSAATPPPGAALLTVPEACAQLRISRWMFYRLVGSGRLHTAKLGRRRLVSPAEIERFVRAETQDGVSL